MCLCVRERERESSQVERLRPPVRADTNHVFEVAPDVPPRVLRLVPQRVPAARMDVGRREKGEYILCTYLSSTALPPTLLTVRRCGPPGGETTGGGS